MRITVYLGGPINGCSDSECKDWRKEAAAVLDRLAPKPDIQIQVLDPMARDYRGREGDFTKEIVEGDKADIRKSDFMLINRPKASDGTIMETFFGWSIGVPIIIIVPKDQPVSPWIRYHTTYVAHSLAEALLELSKRIENRRYEC